VAVLEGTDALPRGIAFDPVADRIFLITAVRVIGVDAATGDATVIADPAVGAGPDFSRLESIALDATNNRVFVFDSPGAIFVVDLLTGDRTLVADASVGAGPDFAAGRIAAMVYDATLGRLIVVAPALVTDGDAVLAVNPVTGDRTVLSGSAVGTGPAFAFGGALSVAADFAGGRVFVAQNSTVLEVDLTSGNRTLLHTGPPYRSAIATDIANSRLLQVRGGALVAIDVLTGAVAILSDDTMGTGPEPAEPRGLEIDAARTRTLVAAYAFE
jgi:hypothetical protein